MLETPLVTIGMTCFNAQDTIVRAINSALAQDYPSFEIVIVDDHSKDDSVSIIEDRIKGLENVRFIKHLENKGVAGAHNTIIRNARGEFIAIFDDDDVSVPYRISTQVKKIQEYEAKTGVDLLACWASGYREYENGYRFHFQGIGSQDDIPIGRDVIAYQLYMPRNPKAFYGGGTPGCTMMVRKRVYERIGLYDETMRRTEDIDFAVRLAKAGGHFIGCKEELVVQTATTGADKNSEKAYKSEYAFITKHKDLFIPPRRFYYALDWAFLRYHHFGGRRIMAFLAFLKLLFKYPVWTFEQFMRSAPRRIKHEWRMTRQSSDMSVRS